MSFSTPSRTLVYLAVALAAAGCKETVGPDKRVQLIEISPKTARLYTVGQQQAFTTALTTEAGTDGEGIEVGYIARDNTLLQVNSAGVATALKKGGSTWVVASAGGKSDSAFVEVPLTSCGTTAATTMTVGQVVTDVGAAGFCAAASTGEYAVIVHNNTLSGTGTTSLEVTGIAVGAPPASGASFSRAVTNSGMAGHLRTWRRDVGAEMRHRRAEAAQVAPLISGAQAWYANRSKRASLSTTASAVGDIMRINVSLTNSCNDSTMVDARVAAVSNTAIVLADPRNPGGGFTDAEYNEFAQMFDSIINPLTVANFGAATDLDNNGNRVLLVFTKSVNERTPANAEFYVGGLTHSRDLFPKTGGVGVVSCAASNVAEMFYLLVPDPTGIVNGNEFDKTFVNAVTDATVAHEYQHLINFARRKYINAGAPQANEELWLNEGLSHMVEELLFYRRTGRSPRSNLGFAETVSSQAVFKPFADYMGGNFLAYDEYVFRAAETSPFEPNDESATRGATWAFLRYAADQTSTSDGSLWFNLVNSGQTGTTNLQNRLGFTATQLLALLRDFTIANYTDDFVTSVQPKYTHPSWNMRSIYPGLLNFPPWPLNRSPIQDGQTTTTSIQAGGIKVYGFRGIAGTDAFVRVTGTSGTALPAGVTISVVRTQ
jgi:hypothetical protein